MKKAFWIVAISLLSAIAAGSFIMLFILGLPLGAPERLNVFADGNSKYLETAVHENAVGYIWSIRAEDGQEFIINSEINVLDISNYVTNNVKYFFKVAYRAEIQSANSGFSEVTEYTFKDRLSPPEITYNSDSKIVLWQEVTGATHYTVYFTIGEEVSTFKATGNSFNYSALERGNYYVYVRAVDSSGAYISSLISNVVNISY